MWTSQASTGKVAGPPGLALVLSASRRLALQDALTMGRRRQDPELVESLPLVSIRKAILLKRLIRV